MTDQLVLNAEPREDVGKGASRRLRRLEKRVPGIIYGGSCTQSVSLEARELAEAEGVEAFYSQVLELKLSGKKIAAVVKDLQRHPARGDIMHIDFLRVSANQPLTVNLAPPPWGGGLRRRKGRWSPEPEYERSDRNGPARPSRVSGNRCVRPRGRLIAAPDGHCAAGRGNDPALAQGNDHDQAVVSVVAARGGAAAEADEGGEAAPAEDGGGEEG